MYALLYFINIISNTEVKTLDNYSKKIKTIDTHTMGEATRIVLDGFPEIKGTTMMEKKEYVRDHHDHLRQLLMNEPRGHKDMFGSILVEPVTEGADLGVIFMDSGSYLNMCGHGTIGTVTMAVTKGLVEAKDVVKIDTPSGLIECFVTYEEGVVQSVAFQNVPAFVLHKQAPLALKDGTKVNVDVAFGGSFFGIVQAEQLGVKIDLADKFNIVAKAMELRDVINTQLDMVHPDLPAITTVDLIEITEKVAENHYRNVVVFGDGQIDRSPCGTGTCAKMATLDLNDNEEIIQESIIGSKFIGKKLGTTKVHEHAAIKPMIKGSAWITGEHMFVLQSNDPYQQGFSI